MAYSNAALAMAPARPFIVVQGAQLPTFNKALFERFIDEGIWPDSAGRGAGTQLYLHR